MDTKISAVADKKGVITLKAVQHTLGKHTNLVTLVVLMVALGIMTGGRALQLGSLQNLMVAEAVRAFAALGVGLIIINRGIDLSIGQVVGLVACVSSSLAQTADYAGALYPGTVFPIFLPVVVGIAVGTLFGIVNGLLVAYGNLPPFIATLGTMSIAAGLQLIYTRASTIGSLKNEYKHIAQGSLGPIPYLMIYVLAAVLILWIMMTQTRQGKAFYAIGGNPQAAQVSGINVKLNLLKVYVLGGFLYGISGVLLSSRLGLANPLTGDGMELDAIAAATVGGISHSGGIGTIGGIFIGVFTLGIITFGMTYMGVDSYYQLLVKGMIIIVAVYFDMKRHAKRG